VYEKSIHFVLKTKVTGIDNIWAAFGLSKDTSMGDDDVALCGIKDGKPIMHHMRNERKAPPSLLDEKNPQVGFSDVKVVLEKDVLVCSFTRVSQMPNVVHYFNTNEEHGYHVLFASGTYVDGKVKYHFTAREVVAEIYNFKYEANDKRHHDEPSDVNVVIPSERKEVMFNENVIVSNIVNDTVLKEVASGRKSHLSYHNGPFKVCWEARNGTVHFAFATNITQLGSENIWSSIAFSRDGVSGEDDMIVCSVNGSSLNVGHYHSMLNSTPVVVDVDNYSLGLTNTSVVVKDGILRCVFDREINMTDSFFDLHKSYHLIFQNGTIENGQIQFVTENRLVSSYKLDFLGTKFSSYLFPSFDFLFKDVIRKFFSFIF